METQPSHSSKTIAEISPRAEALVLLRELFRSPFEALELYLSSPSLGQKELREIKMGLLLLAPVSKFLYNLIQQLFTMGKESDTEVHGFSFSALGEGVVGIFVFYLGILALVSFLDLFRVHYKRVNRLVQLEPPPHNIIGLAFVPFFASGIFWILPPPIPVLFLGLFFFYSLDLGFRFLQKIADFSTREYLWLLLNYSIFLSLFLFGFLFLYYIAKAALG